MRLSIAEKGRRARAKNPAAYMLQQAKTRARKQGLEFSITTQDIIPLPEFCPINGLRLEYGALRGTGKSVDDSASLDRKNNALGYVKGNVAVISMKANCEKGSDSVEDLYRKLQELHRRCDEIWAVIDYMRRP